MKVLTKRKFLEVAMFHIDAHRAICIADRLQKQGYFGKELLTFKRIRKECIPMKHLLIDQNGHSRLYLGFTRSGKLVTDTNSTDWSNDWTESEIKNWTVKEYKGEQI